MCRAAGQTSSRQTYLQHGDLLLDPCLLLRVSLALALGIPLALEALGGLEAAREVIIPFLEVDLQARLLALALDHGELRLCVSDLRRLSRQLAY